ncbi:hypothetical protein AK812_SmicGene28174 [Symbiodinium microadriaticum]|uniref:Uncharacterized protein n=1 Tax=Symbiodinium microadriaticum TaxID=2951 RepID=A0A1Q9D4Z2_SYMMI|nr:hypothetical protein AK812_SmicGene28174 [Symbiodinium microadriaticum]
MFWADVCGQATPFQAVMAFWAGWELARVLRLYSVLDWLANIQVPLTRYLGRRDVLRNMATSLTGAMVLASSKAKHDNLANEDKQKYLTRCLVVAHAVKPSPAATDPQSTVVTIPAMQPFMFSPMVFDGPLPAARLTAPELLGMGPADLHWEMFRQEGKGVRPWALSLISKNREKAWCLTDAENPEQTENASWKRSQATVLVFDISPQISKIRPPGGGMEEDEGEDDEQNEGDDF